MSKLFVTMLGTLLICAVATTVALADKKKNEDKPAERKQERKAPEPKRSEPRPAEQRQAERKPVEQKRVEQPRPAPAPKPAPAPRPERQQQAAPSAARSQPTSKPEAPAKDQRSSQPQAHSAPPTANDRTSSRRNEQPNRQLAAPSRSVTNHDNDHKPGSINRSGPSHVGSQPAITGANPAASLKPTETSKHLPSPRPSAKPNGDRVRLPQSNSAVSGFSAGAGSTIGRPERDRDHKLNIRKPGPIDSNALPAGGPQPAIAGAQSIASLKPKAEPPKHHPKPRPTVKPDRDHDEPALSAGIATGLAAGAASGSSRPDGHRPGDKDHAKPTHTATPGHQGHVVGQIAKPYRSKPVIVHHDHHDDHHDRVIHVDRHHHHYRGSRWIFVGSSGYCWTNNYAAPYGGGYNDSYSVAVINPQPVTVYAPTYLAEQAAVPSSASVPLPPQRTVPSADAFNEMPLPEQQKLMVTALNDLEGDLSQSDTGTEWIDHLQLASIGNILTECDEPLDDSARLRVQAVADIFEEVAQEEEFKSISQLWGFNVLNVGLHVMATDPVVCQRHRVSSAAKALSHVFETWQSSDRWRTYLRLESLVTMDDAPEDLLVRIQEVDVIVTKFDRVQAEAQYQMIHELPAYRVTHLALRAYLNDLRTIAAELEPMPGT